MELLRPLALVAQVSVAVVLIWAGTRLAINRRRARTAGLRSAIAAQLRFETTLDAARVYRMTTFGRDGHAWFSMQGPRRLIVGTDAFIFSAPNALREYAFRGCECCISLSQAPSSLFVKRDWIVITGPAGGRQVQLAISNDNLSEIWRALAAAGAEEH
jgi:hypothetical protein